MSTTDVVTQIDMHREVNPSNLDQISVPVHKSRGNLHLCGCQPLPGYAPRTMLLYT